MRCIFIVVGPRWDFYTHANFSNMVIQQNSLGRKKSYYFNHSKTIRFNLNQIMSAALFLSSHAIIWIPCSCGPIIDSKVAFKHKQKCQVPRINYMKLFSNFISELRGNVWAHVSNELQLFRISSIECSVTKSFKKSFSSITDTMNS